MNPVFEAACAANGGTTDPRRNAFIFATAAEMLPAVRALGFALEVPPLLAERRGRLLITRQNTVFAQVARLTDDPRVQWCGDDAGRYWELVVGTIPPCETIEHLELDLDSWVRCVEAQKQPAGWRAVTDNGGWSAKGASAVKNMLMARLSCTRGDAERLMGGMERRPWTLVKRPFAPEEHGREWNLNAPQLAYTPAPCNDWTTECPHWYKVLSHVGADLGGPTWLSQWLAALLRDPSCKLPYLFLFGPENSGKSILHEAFELLVTSGVVKADRALTNRNDFCGELEHAILCVVEEKDIAAVPGAYEKIKEYVTALRLSIRRMRTDSYMVDNTSHWVQCANNLDACPVFDADTRIQPIEVKELEAEIPKTRLLVALQNEAPRFLHYLLHLHIPEAYGRLSVPLVDTQTRRRLQARNTPTWILAVPDKAPGTYTARDLSGIGCPTDFRRAEKDLEANVKYLRLQGIAFTFHASEKKHARKVTFTKV